MLEVLSLPLLVECSFEDSLVGGGPESETRRSLNKSKEKKNGICIRERGMEKNKTYSEKVLFSYFRIFVYINTK